MANGLTRRYGKGTDSDATDTFVTAATLNSGGNAGGFRTEPGEHLVTGPLGGGNDGIGRRTEDDPNLVVTHALTGEGHDATEDGTGRVTPLVAFDTTQITSAGNYSAPKPGDPCHPLAAGAHAPAIAGSTIRRLTPLECERLQGFPDGWTCLCTPLEAYAADPDAAALACRCPDSPRYRALGNAVTVPVIEWLGHRLMEVTR